MCLFCYQSRTFIDEHLYGIIPLTAIMVVTNEVVCKSVCLYLDVIAMCMGSDYITIDGDLRHVFARTTAVNLHLNDENTDSTMLRRWYVFSNFLAPLRGHTIDSGVRPGGVRRHCHTDIHEGNLCAYRRPNECRCTVTGAPGGNRGYDFAANAAGGIRLHAGGQMDAALPAQSIRNMPDTIDCLVAYKGCRLLPPAGFAWHGCSNQDSMRAINRPC